MPSLVVIVIAVLVATISILAAMLAAAERQYDRPAPPDRAPPPPPGPGVEPSRLVPVATRALEEATRVRPRNTSEVQAAARLREALALAVDGDFGAEVQAVLDATAGIAALHDVRRSTVGGPSIDHLVVGPAGAVVVDSVVRTTKVVVSPDAVLVGRGRERTRDPMVDHVLREMGTVVALAGAVPVHGVIVFRDVLTLPAEIREGRATVRGVRLLTLRQLADHLRRPGAITDAQAVLRRLAAGFEPALPSPAQQLGLGASRR